MQIPSAMRYIWAAPASAIGAGLALAALLIGARARLNTGVLEISLRPTESRLASGIARLPFSAITFGHVVLAATELEQEIFRAHERVHVAQYERWGALLLLAYPAESLLQLILGRRPYQNNRFEIAARADQASGRHRHKGSHGHH